MYVVRQLKEEHTGGLGCVGIKAYAGMEASSRMNETKSQPWKTISIGQ
jgi:hypothetical protein